MMRFDKFSERAQDVAARAAEIIQRYGHNQIDSEHILLALIEQPEGTVSQLIEMANVEPGVIADRLDVILRTTPKANIFGGPSGQVFLTPRVKMVVDLAKTEATEDKLYTVVKAGVRGNYFTALSLALQDLAAYWNEEVSVRPLPARAGRQPAPPAS